MLLPKVRRGRTGLAFLRRGPPRVAVDTARCLASPLLMVTVLISGEDMNDIKAKSLRLRVHLALAGDAAFCR